MKVTILGIDGLELNILEHHLADLPNFNRIKNNGVLKKVETIFPADSVPAWNTIFTGLNPAEHGVIRGKDFAENIDNFDDLYSFKLKGNTFWDKLSENKKKCLIINPYLAYPAWVINGIMESGPAFVEGPPTYYPSNIEVKYDNILGGYRSIDNISSLRKNIEDAYKDTENLWNEYIYQNNKDTFDLAFITFTTLDRIQHYTWRYYDQSDTLFEQNEYLSNIILKTLKLLDSFIGIEIDKMAEDDILLIISDHGFGQRPKKLVNMNEVFRQKGFLKLKNENTSLEKSKQKLRTSVIRYLSHARKLDLIKNILKIFPAVSKYKKLSYLIDKNESLCYVDEYFNGKKPYCGLNFGIKIKHANPGIQYEAFEKISDLLNSGIVPKPLWIKRNDEMYKGKFQDRLPDICFEFPSQYGIEYDLFGDIFTDSVTHYKISGGHLGPGTFGFYSPNKTCNPISTILDFHNFTLNCFK
jgi:predicted AlkP superfamily phosphohydrolase/phosphomutase